MKLGQCKMGSWGNDKKSGKMFLVPGKKSNIFGKRGEDRKMQTTTHTLKIGSWNLSDSHGGSFSADQMIDAYQKGKAAAIQQAQEAVANKMSSGLYKSGDMVIKAIGLLKELGLDPLSAFLRIGGNQEFQALIGLSEEDFLSEAMLEAYLKLAEMELAYGSEQFRITFSLADLEGEIDISAIHADGYIFELSES